MGLLWSEQTLEQRVDTMIKYYEKRLESIDPDNTARTHTTYLADREHHTRVSECAEFLHQLQILKEKVDESKNTA